MTSRVPLPGLQVERTALAWRRSSLAFLVVALLVARVAAQDGVPILVVMSLLAGAVALWSVVAGLRTRWSMPSSAEPDYVVLRDGALPMTLTGVAATLCVVVVLLALRVTG